MTQTNFDINAFVDAFDAHEELVSPTLATGLITGVALLPKELSPSEWFNLLWCGEEPTIADADLLNAAFNRAIAFYRWVLDNTTESLLDSIAAINIEEFAMGTAMALNWGQDLWSEVGIIDESDNDHLIGALMLVCVTLAWPSNQRPKSLSLPSLSAAQEQFATALTAVKQISQEYRCQVNDSE